MKRRKFGLMAGSSMVTAATGGLYMPAWGQSTTPDPSLLKTMLTPSGAERAGNADGSIPAWTGGVVGPPLGPNDPQDVPMFGDEQPLYMVDASNMAQYSDLLNDGVKKLMTDLGFRLKVYPTHRTAAWPQYFMDNMALNVSRAIPEPSGLRFGFTGAYGGYPFPIINTADPMIGGAQVIWNHLIGWNDGFQEKATFAGGWVVTGNRVTLTFGSLNRFSCPFFDPNGSPETYDGYFSKLHNYAKTPASANGQEALVWTSSNVLRNPDITWSVVNGQGRVRKAPDEAYDTPSASADGIGNYDDPSGFEGSPQKYDWNLLGKKEMLIPYNCNNMCLANASDLVQPGFPNPDLVRWEKHRVWVVEATLHPGERNTTHRRMLYLNEDTYMCNLAEMYDADNNMVKTVTAHNRVVPHLPGTCETGYALWQFAQNAYTLTGFCRVPPYDTREYFGPEAAEFFDPQQMAASASF